MSCKVNNLIYAVLVVSHMHGFDVRLTILSCTRDLQSSSVCFVDMFIDDVIRIVVIWSTAAVFSHSAADAAIYTGFSASSMLLCGYVIAAVLMTIGRVVLEKALRNSKKEMHRLAVEDAYVALLAVASIMVCRG